MTSKSSSSGGDTVDANSNTQNELPLNLAARCASYNVSSTMDIAKLRVVSKSFGRALKAQLQPEGEGGLGELKRSDVIDSSDHDNKTKKLKTSHFLECPRNCVGDNSAVSRFLMEYDPEDVFNYRGYCVGDIYNLGEMVNDHREFRIFPDIFIKELLIFAPPQPLSEFQNECSRNSQMEDGKEEASTSVTTTITLETTQEERCQRLEALCCNLLEDCKSFQDFQDCYQRAKREGLLLPISNDSDAFKIKKDDNRQWNVYPMLLTFELPASSDSIQHTFTDEDGNEFVELQTTWQTSVPPSDQNDGEDEGSSNPNIGNDDDDQERKINLLYPGGWYLGLVIPRNDYNSFETKQIQLPFLAVGEEEHLQETLGYETPVFNNLVLDGIVESILQNENAPVEGVVIVDDAIGENLHVTLNNQIQALANSQVQNNLVDYHPHSRKVVRDLVHPGLYSYIKDVTPLRAQVEEVEPCIFPNADISPSSQIDGKDYWGRPYESSKYQWLPTYVTVDTNGRCVFEDYINNLNKDNNGPLYDSLARLLEESLPYMESVYSYVHAVRPHLREEGEEIDWGVEKFPELKLNPITFRGQRLQVIPKIVDYELKPGQAYDGVWHVEGMSHEEIVLTALYILDRDEDIEGGSIAFQRAFLRDEAAYVHSNIPQCRPHPVESFIEKGLIPLGKVETPKGRLIVFPNSHVHRVQEMINNQISAGDSDEEARVARRRIVVFFLVNPLRRIVSTREVAPQQQQEGSDTMTSRDEAFAHRLALMEERKYHKQDWNVREIELCEH